jgi:hypothetical protein
MCPSAMTHMAVFSNRLEERLLLANAEDPATESTFLILCF